MGRHPVRTRTSACMTDTDKPLIRRARTLLPAVLLAAACALLAACGSGTVRNPNLLQNQEMRAPDTSSESGVYKGGSDYRIGAQDLLEIRVFGIEELDKEEIGRA